MFKTSRNTTSEDPTISARPGWEGMHVWWLIERQHGGSQHAVFNMTVFPPEKSHEVHRHAHAEEFFYVIEGSGLHLSDGEPMRLQAGDIVFVPINEWHGFANDTDAPTTVITVMGGVGSYQDAGYEVFPEK